MQVRGDLAGGFGPQELAFRCQVELQSAEDLAGPGEAADKVARAHGWQVGAGCRLGAELGHAVSPLCVSLPEAV